MDCFLKGFSTSLCYFWQSRLFWFVVVYMPMPWYILIKLWLVIKPPKPMSLWSQGESMGLWLDLKILMFTHRKFEFRRREGIYGPTLILLFHIQYGGNGGWTGISGIVTLEWQQKKTKSLGSLHCVLLVILCMHYRLSTNIHHSKLRWKQDAQPIGVKNFTVDFPSSIHGTRFQWPVP